MNNYIFICICKFCNLEFPCDIEGTDICGDCQSEFNEEEDEIII